VLLACQNTKKPGLGGTVQTLFFIKPYTACDIYIQRECIRRAQPTGSSSVGSEMRWSLLLVALAGCLGEPYDHVVENQGRLCISSYPQDIAPSDIGTLGNLSGNSPIVAGERVAVQVTVVLNSEGCPEDAGVSICMVIPAEQGLRVVSRIAWNDTRQLACTRELKFGRASCVTPSLPAGELTILFGDAAASVPIPGLSACLIDSDPSSPR